MAIKDALVAELKHEASNTRKILERLPAEKFNWKPHEKSFSLIKLAQHIANLPVWTEYTVLQDELDLGKPIARPEIAKTTSELLDFFDKRLSDAVGILNNASDEVLNQPWTMKRDSQVFFTLPKKVVIRNMILNHIVHHRGQLSVYLRLLDIPVPGMYGPSADERT